MAASPAPCYQAVRRHLRPPCRGVRTPDSLFSTGFHLQHAPNIFVRHGSYVPGPLEHRKRVTRRSMAELQFGQSHSAAPIWDLASLVDLTQWKWKPPTTPDVKKPQNTSTAVPRTLSETLQSLISPSIDPTPGILPDGIALRGVAESPQLPQWGSEHTSADIIDAGLVSLSYDILRTDKGLQNFTEFCQIWRQALKHEPFHGDAVVEVLTGIDHRLGKESLAIYGPKTVDHVKVCLVQATIEGLSNEATGKTQLFDHHLWNSILHYMSTIRINIMRVFTTAIVRIPAPCIKDVLPGIMSCVGNFLNGLGNVIGQSSVTRQADKMALALNHLGKAELRLILDDVTQMLSTYNGVENVNSANLRLGWLHMLARLRGMDMDYLTWVCNALDANTTFGPLTEAQICRLCLAWVNRRAPLKNPVKLLRDSRYAAGPKCYYLLASRLWETGQFCRIKHFAAFLEATGREADIVWLAKGVRNPLTWGPSVLGIMAMGLKTPRVAIDIYCLYEESLRRRIPFWKSPFGFKALEILTQIPTFDPKKLWRLLHISPRKDFRAGYHRRRIRPLDLERLSKIAAVAAVVGLSPHISRKTSFAFMTHCYIFLRRRYTKLPPYIARALVHNITRDIALGQAGVTSKLKYVLHIIQREFGNDHAESTELQIRRMRAANMKNK